MVQSVLGSLILGYRPLWNRARKLAGIQLYAHNEASATVDGGHLLRTLQELWSASSPPLLISAQTRQLLCDLLENAPRAAPWIEVRGAWLSDSAIYDRVKAAHQRGLRMVYHHRKIDRKLFEKYRRRFSPYCSVASLYLWAAAGGAVPGLKDYALKKKAPAKKAAPLVPTRRKHQKYNRKGRCYDVHRALSVPLGGNSAGSG